jgi:hypothetical protein
MWIVSPFCAAIAAARIVVYCFPGPTVNVLPAAAGHAIEGAGLGDGEGLGDGLGEGKGLGDGEGLGEGDGDVVGLGVGVGVVVGDGFADAPGSASVPPQPATLIPKKSAEISADDDLRAFMKSVPQPGLRARIITANPHRSPIQSNGDDKTARRGTSTHVERIRKDGSRAVLPVTRR